MGESRIEKILENMQGAENEILEPFSRNEELLIQISEQLEGVPSEPVSSLEIQAVIETIE